MFSIKSFLVTYCSWSVLKKIGGSKLATATILIPVLGYFLVYNDFVIQVFSNVDKEGRRALDTIGIGRSLNSEHVSPSFNSSKIKLMYIGLWFIGTGTLLFKICCPQIIQKYQDTRDYAESSMVISSPHFFHLVLEKAQKSRWYDFAVDGKSNIDRIEVNNEVSAAAQSRELFELNRKDWLEKNVNNFNTCLQIFYELENYSKIFLRIPIFLLFALGFTLVSIPSIQTLIQVIQLDG